MDTSVTRAEHAEFQKQLDAKFADLAHENNRQNHRLDALEGVVSRINELSISVSSLSTSVQQMANNINDICLDSKEVDGRLKVIENRDGERWRDVTNNIIVAAVMATIGYLAAKLHKPWDIGQTT